MKNIQLSLAILSLFTISCNTPKASNEEIITKEKSIEELIKSIDTNPIDTNVILKIVADDILERLNSQQITSIFSVLATDGDSAISTSEAIGTVSYNFSL